MTNATGLRYEVKCEDQYGHRETFSYVGSIDAAMLHARHVLESPRLWAPSIVDHATRVEIFITGLLH